MRSFSLIVMTLSAALAQQPQYAVVSGAPYSADQVQEYTRLENGQSVTTANVIGHFYRDSQGRTRTEAALKYPPAWRIEIRDPIAGATYLLDDKKKVSYRSRMQSAAPAPNPRAVTTSLGAQSIDGLAAEGTRTTFPGLTVETWDSIELKVTLRSTSSNGYSSKLVNLRRDEPDPALFRPPAEYTIIDQ